MTKAELENRVKELEKKLKECEHLASAVEAKDDEIIKLKEKHKIEITEKVKELQKIIDASQSKRESEIEKIYKNNDENIKNMENRFNRQIEDLNKKLNSREHQLAKLINIFGNSLKGLQGSLDNAIELNEYFLDEVK